MPVPIIAWGAAAAVTGVIAWGGGRAASKIVDDVDVIGDVLIGTLAGWATANVTKSAGAGLAVGVGTVAVMRGASR